MPVPHLNLYNATRCTGWRAWARRWVMPTEMKREDLACCSGSPRAWTEVFAWAASRWRSPRAASPHATPTCPRTTAASAASPIRTARSCTRDRRCRTASRPQSARVQPAAGPVRAGHRRRGRAAPEPATARHGAGHPAVRRRAQRRLTGTQAQHSLRALLPGEDCNGYWHGRPGLEQVRRPRMTLPRAPRVPAAAGLAAGASCRLFPDRCCCPRCSTRAWPHLPADVAS